jgi:hypothetical protein
VLAHIPPSRAWFTCGNRPYLMAHAIPGSEPGAGHGPPSAQSPFANKRCYLSPCNVSHYIRGRYPSIIAHTGSCARPRPSLRLRLSLLRRVFAGCHQPLLGIGPSRHYLHNLCMVAGTHTPQCPFGAFTRFFPKGFGLHLLGISLAHLNTPYNATSTGRGFSELQSFLYVPAPILARPPCCTYR